MKLRLGLDRDWSMGEEEEERHSDTLTHHRRLHTLHTTPLHHTPHLPRDGTGVQEEEGEGVGERKSKGQGRMSEREGRRLKLQSKGSELSRNHGDKEVFHYISKQFGPPTKQLLHLSSRGAFKTHSLRPTAEEKQGGGACEVAVRWPVEAHISLPTPHHITPSQHGRQPFHDGHRERDSQHPPAGAGMWTAMGCSLCQKYLVCYICKCEPTYIKLM